MPQSTQPPTQKEFCIDYPLYEEYTFGPDQDRAGWYLLFSRGPIDTYCPKCESHSIFHRSHHQYINSRVETWIDKGHVGLALICSRDREHELFFLFDVVGRTVRKIGQYPSLADLNTADVRQYSSVLPKEDFREFTKAIGLAAHGVGVGSFVYLRRIFENLVQAAYLLAKDESGWDDEAYGKGRMADRIRLLEKHLPEFLVQNHSMYGILSRGLHELTESACLEAFPVMKMGIELILDEKLAAKARQAKLEQAKKAIQGIASQS